MEWYYVWWPWLTSKCVARVCQHQLSFLFRQCYRQQSLPVQCTQSSVLDPRLMCGSPNVTFDDSSICQPKIRTPTFRVKKTGLLSFLPPLSLPNSFFHLFPSSLPSTTLLAHLLLLPFPILSSPSYRFLISPSSARPPSPFPTVAVANRGWIMNLKIYVILSFFRMHCWSIACWAVDGICRLIARIACLIYWPASLVLSPVKVMHLDQLIMRTRVTGSLFTAR